MTGAVQSEDFDVAYQTTNTAQMRIAFVIKTVITMEKGLVEY